MSQSCHTELQSLSKLSCSLGEGPESVIFPIAFHSGTESSPKFSTYISHAEEHLLYVLYAIWPKVCGHQIITSICAF